MVKAGVVGLGMIGGGVSLCLARAGLLGAVYDVRPDAADGLEGVPSVIATPRELAAQTDVVIIAVVSAEQTIDVLSGPNGVLAAARPELTVVLVATVSLDALNRIRSLTDAAGVGLVDCGVTGGQAVQRNGLVCLVGGEPARLKAVQPVLEGFAKSVAHMGGPGAGMAAKIARNVVVYGSLRAGYEGAALARAAGVSVAQLAQVIEDSSDGVGGPMMMLGRPKDPLLDPDEEKMRLYVLNLLQKDLAAAQELGKSLGVDLPLVDLTQATGRETVGLGAEK